MLKDKGFVAKVTLPALSATEKAKFALDELGVSPAAYGDLQAVMMTSAAATLSIYKDSSGKKWVRFTATGSVSANTVVYVYFQVVGDVVEVSATKES